MGCSPPLQLVQNGPTGNLPVQPLDPTPPTIPNSPTFTDVANGFLAGLCMVGDPCDTATADATTAAGAVEAAGIEMDATLDTILELLDSIDATTTVQSLEDVFTSDQAGIDSLLGQADPSLLPALAPLALVDPSGTGTTTYGGSPTTGGVPTAGSPAYQLQVVLPRQASYIGAPQGASLSGPNPPFTGLQGFQQVPNPAGGTQWVALIGINPAADGSFTATLSYTVPVSITGIQGLMNVSLPINVVVSG